MLTTEPGEKCWDLAAILVYWTILVGSSAGSSLEESSRLEDVNRRRDFGFNERFFAVCFRVLEFHEVVQFFFNRIIALFSQGFRASYKLLGILCLKTHTTQQKFEKL